GKSSRGYLAYAPFAEHHTEQHSAATKSLGLEVGPARVAAHMRTNRLHGQRAVSGRAPVATPAGAWVCSSMVAKCNSPGDVHWNLPPLLPAAIRRIGMGARLGSLGPATSRGSATSRRRAARRHHR